MLLPGLWFVWVAVLVVWLLMPTPSAYKSNAAEEEEVVLVRTEENTASPCALCFYALDDVMANLEALKQGVPEMRAELVNSADVHAAAFMLSDVYTKVTQSVSRLHDVYECVEEC